MSEYDLTDDEIAQIEAAEKPFFITHNLGASGKHHTQLTVGGARAIGRIVAAREAAARREAWDEGHDACDHSWSVPPNPYWDEEEQ